MANEKKRELPRGSDTAYRSSGSERSSDMQNLLDRAPQLGKLAKVAAGQAPEPTPSQKEFLREFASQLTAGVVERDDASAPAAAPKAAKPVDPRARPKRGR